MVGPEYVLAPETLKVPLPCLATPPLPEIAPSKFVLLAVPNVKILVLLFPRIRGEPDAPDKSLIVGLPPAATLKVAPAAILIPELKAREPPAPIATVPELILVAPV